MKEQQQTGAVMLGGHRGQIQKLRPASREARRVGRAAVLRAGRSVRGARGAGGLQGRAAALGLREALVVPVQTQILHGHQLTCQDQKQQPVTAVLFNTQS